MDEGTKATTSASKWIKYHDPTTSQPYYYNTTTKITQWEQPPDFKDETLEQEPDNGDRKTTLEKAEQFITKAKANSTRVNADAEDSAVAGNEYVARLNAIFEKSTDKHKEGDNLPPGWKKYWDKEANRAYYHHEESNTTQWKVPVPSSSDKYQAVWLAETKAPEAAEAKAYESYESVVKVNQVSGRFFMQGGEEHFERNGIPTDKAGRQMSHFFNPNDLEANRAEAVKIKEKLKRSRINWKEIEKAKKKRKRERNAKWLLED